MPKSLDRNLEEISRSTYDPLNKERTTLSTNREKIVTLGRAIVFTVPDRVAEENGLFEKHGLDVVPSEGWTTSLNFVPGHPEHDPLAAFEHIKFDTWNMCEWVAVHRVEKGEARPARIAFLRPAVVVQAIVSFEP